MLWLKARFPARALIGMPRRVTVRARRHHPWVMVWTMAVAQVISWGTLFYAFSLFVVPMHERLGWSRPLLNGALSLGLLSPWLPGGGAALAGLGLGGDTVGVLSALGAHWCQYGWGVV